MFDDTEGRSLLVFIILSISCFALYMNQCSTSHRTLAHCSTTSTMTKYKDYSKDLNDNEVPWKYAIRVYNPDVSQDGTGWTTLYADLSFAEAERLCDLDKGDN